MVITSGASPAATEVASLSKYPEMSPGSALMITSGFFSRNGSIACSVVAARSVSLHQEKRREEESPSAWPAPVTLGPQAAREVLARAVRDRAASAVRREAIMMSPDLGAGRGRGRPT